MPFSFFHNRIIIAATVILSAIVIAGRYYWLHRSPKEQEPLHAVSDLESMRSHAVKVAPAGLETYVKAPGIIDFHPKHALRIHPTFPGIVLKASKNLGDVVNPGDILATVESNIGIQVYTVTSPIKGVVLSKSVGEGQSVLPEEEIFSVGDVSVLQARLSISAKDVKKVVGGQAVVLVAENQKMVRDKIQFLSPILDEETRTASAIIDFKSTDMRPGMFITGAIVVETRQVSKSLPIEFCENNERKKTVSVIGAKAIETREVTFGARDYQNCEILTGLEINDEVLSATAMVLADKEEEDHHEHE